MERAEGRPGAPQYVHVQLQGGAPWGFTLRGGLEHGEPLIVSKVEDGGKAALSRRLQPGDELVNISGTPLYGSRQEALILIKGSYRTLKMVVRRRSVPVFRPHSWHVAKLAESRPDVPTMHCPADAFSLSWPSGCDVSTDRSSSIGSMESLDHPSQACCEGDPSPVDQGMYHSKRDSAYSSFSASSIASDCALSLRPEEAVSIDSSLQGPCKAPDRRYLTTGAEPSASWHPEAWRAPVPPQPPVRRDSLRAAPAGRGDRCQASVSVDMLHAKGRWISDTFLCQRDGEAEVVGRRKLVPYPKKDCLSADQYYMLSSHLDRCAAEPLRGESMEPDNQPYLDDSIHQVPDATTAGDNPLLSPLKGHVSHRHSAPERLLASQFRSLQLGTNSGRASPAPSGQRWTLSPMRPEGSRGGTTGAAQDPPHCPEPCCRPLPCRCCPELQQACGPDGQGASPVLSTEGPVEEENREGARRAGGPPHRSAQMRRRSDRFATSLRNEIQRRKAQLQKSRGPCAPPPGEEPVEETEEPPEGSVLAERHPALPECLSPAPSEESRNSGPSADRGIPTPDPVPAPKGPLSPERVVPTARGHWRWSPGNKLQPKHSPSHSELEGYSQGPAACSSPPRGSDEAVLLPFADRRRFFEESSRLAPPRHSKPPAGDPSTFQPPGPEHRDVRRLSVDQPYSPPSPSRPGSAGPYAECCREQPHCYKPLGRPGELDYLRGFSYPYGVPLRPEPCRYCGGDLCPPPVPRGHTCRCHPVSWVRCPDCCYPATHPGREESDAWPPRRAFVPEFPQDEWEPPAITRKVSQSIRQGFEPISLPPRSAASSSSFPMHYGVAVGKTEPLNKVKALPEVVEGSSEDEEEEVDHELVEKKLQLIESLSRKLVVLQEAQRGLQEDISANGALGEDVAARLQALCTPGEFDKYRLFVGDLDKVVNLLLSLSGRLARVETALSSLGPHAPAEDKLALREKQRLLVAQLEDAKELKEHVGRREEAVGAMVARYLPAEHLQDYQHFVKMKSALIAEQRELEEKIKLGQEQLRCLRESLGQASKNC
ncbi:protein Shroom4 isoform X7 [Passer domesticus]|uniref:protein Shroom4 isoform X7 n=1 Tax=Passer domesticus TaxID=48849 RepID=UPI0030FE154E